MIIDYAMEGATIDKTKYQDQGFKFSDLDIRKRTKTSKNGKNDGFEVVCDFTGFLVNNENDILTVFPKHFPIENENLESDSQLLFRVFMKSQTKKTMSMLGKDMTSNFQSDYPFEAFFRVYNYFSEYGLLFDDRKLIKPNEGGKIKWKDTLSKGNIYIENGKTILFPFYYEKKYSFSTFLTEAMIFVIDYTLMKFKYFIDLPDTGRDFPEFDFLSAKQYVIECLYSYQETEFKDSVSELIDGLIEFFHQINGGGNYYLKHYLFESVWEDMVAEFLNGNFDSYTNGKLLLKSNVKKGHFKKKSFFPNALNINESIQPDHYFVDEFNNQVNFDAKYYSEIQGMNYKQICYHLFLENYIGNEYPDNITVKNGRSFPNTVINGFGGPPSDNKSYYEFIEQERLANRVVPKYKNVYSALIMPAKVRERKEHVQISSIYAAQNLNVFISEEYFNIKEVMQYYLDKRFVITED